MPNISLTDFLDFVVSSGTPRLTKVRQIKCRGEYDPRFDFWKQLREAISAFHDPTNTTSKNQFFQSFLNNMNNESKRESYRPVVRNYISFLGLKQMTTLPAQRTTWTHNGLEVRINPELHLAINGEAHLYKLYFKADPLSKAKVDSIIALLKAALPNVPNIAHYGVFDARHNKKIKVANPNQSLLVLLRAEADSFLSIWNETQC